MSSLIKKTFIINDSTLDCWIVVVQSENGIPQFWFKGRNIASFLDYKSPKDAISYNVPPKHRKLWHELKAANSLGPLRNTPHNDESDSHTAESHTHSDDATTPTNWQPHTIFISEPGVYALAMRSKKPEAVKFQDWVFEVVLPSLRSTGTFSLSSQQQYHNQSQPGPSSASSSSPSSPLSSPSALALRCENTELKHRVIEFESRIAIERSDAERQLVLARTDAEKQLVIARADAEKQIALMRQELVDEMHKLQTALMAKDHEIELLERDFRHEQLQLVQEFRNVVLYGAGCSAERVDAAEVHAEMMEERAADAESKVSRIQQRLHHLHETASIAPTVALRECGKNPLLVIFSEEHGKYFSVSRLQAASLKTRKYSHLVDGVWTPSHPSPHFMDLPVYEARRLLLCVEVANAVGSWALIRTTNLRLFFGTYSLEGSTYLFTIVGDTVLARHFRQFNESLMSMRPNVKKPPRLERFVNENFVDEADFLTRCRLYNAEHLCAVIRDAVSRDDPLTAAPLTTAEIQQRPNREHRMVIRKRTRDETMRGLLESLSNTDDCNLFSENVKRWLNK